MSESQDIVTEWLRKGKEEDHWIRVGMSTSEL